ncbi:MAG: hypothetical protein HYU66_25250, partial [Armatimonadetes bacterium]|nr:hypothetical protein [Armatimonadota bacterium]
TGAAGALYALLDSGITRRLGDRGRPAGDPFHTATVTGWTRHLELACTYRPGGDALALAAAGQPVTWRDGKLSADWVEQAAPAGPLRWEGTEPAVVACLEWDRWQPQRAVPWPPGGQGRLAGDADQLVCLNDRGTWALGESGWRVASTRAFDAPSPTFDVDHWSIPDLPPPLHITCRSARGEQLDRLDDEGRFPMDEVRGAAPWAGLVWVVHDWGVTAWEPGAQPRRRHEMPFLDRGILPGAGRLGLGVAEGALWLKVTYRGGREALLELTRSQLDHAQPRKLAFRTVSTGARVESPWERRGEQHCSEPRQLAWRPGATVVTLSEPGRPPQRVELSDRVVYACRHGGWFWVVTRQGLHRLR